MNREELLNGYKEDVRDFAKECVHFEGELDDTFFDNWAEHFTNLAERLRQSLPEGLEEAAMRDSLDYVDSIPDGGTDKHPWNDHDVEKAYYDGMLAGAEWQKAKMMEEAVGGRYMKADGKVYVESWLLDIDPDSVKAGDEVRLIVIPEEK